MYIEIEAKSLLAHKTKPDPWFGFKYNMNIYRGCEHQCIYCDSRSECYGIDNFNDILVKVNAIDLLQKELASKRVKGTIGTGSMSDPYTFAERKYKLFAQALKVIAQFHFPIHIITKSNLVERDLEILKEINRIYAAVSFTVTTVNDQLARKLEPHAPSPTHRFKAMEALAKEGIYVGITMMPILPFIEDDLDNIKAILYQARESGARYIIPWFGMTLRDRQREFYYHRLDEYFPGLKKQYQKRFGNSYYCSANSASDLEKTFRELCSEYGIKSGIEHYNPEPDATQLSLF